MNKRIFSLVLLLVVTVSGPIHAQGVVNKVARAAYVTPAVVTKNLARSVTSTVLHTPKWTRPLMPTNSPVSKSVFRAFPKGNPNGLIFSGFVFKTTHNGQEEIFGVIAQHAASSQNDFGTLGKTFTARITQGNNTIDIPAEIVKMTSPSMLDIALVKFRPEDEPLLIPLTLAKQDPSLEEPLQVVGFGNGQLSRLTDSPLREKSMISLRFPMTGERWDWPGLCGSPVLNNAGEVVGTFTGVARKPLSPQANPPQTGLTTSSDKPPFIGYATKNSYLQTLVSAFHREIEGSTFPLILGGEKIVELEEDEFVAIVILRNEDEQILFKKDIQKKFPYSTVMERLPNARYIELYIDHVWWNGQTLVEGSYLVNGMRHVVYDLKTKQILPGSAVR
ncbi:MAG: trypsin-like peptidase domain-containing protein [Elusimicrobiaceae bacterium]|nr:trypsin-like peptidase domain-containing protein [Elusimicrobiaceae bacterium]